MPQSSTFGAGRHTYRIPSSATNIRVYLASGQGGQGGGDAGNVVGGSKGAGQFGRFRLPNSFAGDLFELYVGAGGGGGKDVGQTAFAGGSGGTNGSTTSAGVIPNPTGYGSDGGNDRPGGSSGGGGGGGGSTIIRNLDRGSELTRTLIWAGGGGGGGGGSNSNYNGPTLGSYDGGSAGGFTAVADVNMSVQIANGGNAVFTNGGNTGIPSCDAAAGGDGGGVGGGGGGYTAGLGGGCAGNDQQGGAGAANRASGGEGGASAYSGQAGITLESSILYIPTSDVTTVPASAADKKGGDGYVYFTWDSIEVTSFTASPNPQDSGNDGTPNYNTTLNWTLSAPVTGVELTLTSSAGESWDVSGTSSFNITNLPQSVATSASPSTRTYTLYVGNSSSSSFSNLTVQAYNDNTPSNSWTTSFTNLEPSTEYPKLLGTFSGIDMVTAVSSPNDGVFFANGANGSYANPQYFTNGQAVYIKMTTLPFNTDVSGVTGDFGKTNTKTVSVTIGSLSAFDVSYVTRKPRISEDFNYDGQSGGYPFEDIDLIANSPTSTLVTQTLNMDDIEIDMEIKTDDPNIEIKINNGGWQSIRQI